MIQYYENHRLFARLRLSAFHMKRLLISGSYITCARRLYGQNG